MGDRDTAQLFALTPMERRCFELRAQHLSAKEIARELDLSVYTVQDHLKRATAKVGGGGSVIAAQKFMRSETEFVVPPKVGDTPPHSPGMAENAEITASDNGPLESSHGDRSSAGRVLASLEIRHRVAWIVSGLLVIMAIAAFGALLVTLVSGPVQAPRQPATVTS